MGNFAFQIDCEISHAKFRALREFLARRRYTLWTLAGVIHSTRGLREISHSEIHHRECVPPTPHRPPLPLRIAIPSPQSPNVLPKEFRWTHKSHESMTQAKRGLCCAPPHSMGPRMAGGTRPARPRAHTVLSHLFQELLLVHIVVVIGLLAVQDLLPRGLRHAEAQRRAAMAHRRNKSNAAELAAADNSGPFEFS